MCGHCIIFAYDEVLDIIQKIEVGAPLNVDADWPARCSDAYPGSVAPLIVAPDAAQNASRSPAAGLSGAARGTDRSPAGDASGSALRAHKLIWGFEEAWRPGVVFNTRIESARKPTWRESMERRRCILPMPAFFEAHREEMVASPTSGRPIRRQYEFRLPSGEIMLVGCIWKGGRFSMVTTEANADVAPIHHRMPLVVHQDEVPQWLGAGFMGLADRSGIRLDVEPAQPRLGTLPKTPSLFD